MKIIAFNGDKKEPLKTFLARPEYLFIEKIITKIPKYLEGYHLTLMSIIWSAGTILGGFLARYHRNWLWLSSAMLILHWLTDSFDGALGRLRNTGIPRWGYYMDRFLDYIFMSSILIGYSVLSSSTAKYIWLLAIPIFGAYMINTFLAFSVTGEFKMSFLLIGPTEIRLLFFILNVIAIFYGIKFIEFISIYIFIVAILGLIVLVWITQKRIWKTDKENIID